MKNTFLYLAYGSNMNRTQIKNRCPTAKFIDSGYLKGYRLVFDGYAKTWKSLVADIRDDQKSNIPYVLWEIIDDDLTRLNAHEGYPIHYDLKRIDTGDQKDVLVYYMTEGKKKERKPDHRVSKKYENTIREAYNDHNLDFNYLNQALLEANTADVING